MAPRKGGRTPAVRAGFKGMGGKKKPRGARVDGGAAGTVAPVATAKTTRKTTRKTTEKPEK